MNIVDGVLQVSPFGAVTIGIIVLFIGKRLNDSIGFLREFSIPEPVSGGLLFSLLFTLIYALFGFSMAFDLAARDLLLVYFFTTIGINANIRDLFAGGMPLVILIVITVSYMLVQNLTGIGIASLFGLHPTTGMLGGTVSLIGGHGTAIAWAPRITEAGGASNAMEIGMACATFGLILASLMGGPIAKFLIKRHNLSPEEKEAQNVGMSEKRQDQAVSYLDFLDALLAIHVCIILGNILNGVLEASGIALPLFVSCLLCGIVLTSLSSLKPEHWRWSGKPWPTRQPALALIAEMSLGTFLAMSLMSLQLWTLVDLAGPIVAILVAQFVIAVSINLLIVFRAMGKNYDAAVICAGFGGISLGSTPTAMANMAAVSQRYGASNLAFLVVPLVCAFFIDIANAIIIPLFLAQF